MKIVTRFFQDGSLEFHDEHDCYDRWILSDNPVDLKEKA